MWGKGGRCVRLTTYHNPVPLSRNEGTLTSWNPLGHSRPVMGLLYLTQELSEWDKVSRLQFRSEFVDMKNNSDIVNTFVMYVKAHFLVSGYVNKQNCRYWTPNNPHELQQRPLHSAN